MAELCHEPSLSDLSFRSLPLNKPPFTNRELPRKSEGIFACPIVHINWSVSQRGLKVASESPTVSAASKLQDEEQCLSPPAGQWPETRLRGQTPGHSAKACISTIPTAGLKQQTLLI